MFLIQSISAAPLQELSLVLENGTIFSLTLYFRPMQQGWFINELVYLDFILRGVRITNSPNILNQWANKLPFGLGCFSTANREPGLQEDFLTGASKLYVLSEDEVAEYSEFLRIG